MQLVWVKSMYLAAKGIVVGMGCQTLACALAVTVLRPEPYT